ncbi:MAG: AMP-binding protein, partial [candidate division Zixibacteria bacterium]|nr:AMP-binding protein [candidate division Zixibacteria bacterium]
KMYHSMRRGIAAAPFHRRFLLSILKALSLIGWKLGRKWGKPLFAALRRKIGLGSLRIFVSGGAAIPPQVARFFNLLGFDFLQGYGLTETAPVLSVNRQHDIKFGSVGPPLKNVEIKIFEPDSTGTGEIIARGENITPGYRDQPGKTAELLRDGWLHTGDLGRIKKGHLWITGRMKNLIVSAAGKNIYPEQIEEKLLESGYVMEAVVFGRKKTGKQGEEVRALIVPDLEQFKADFAMSPVQPDVDLIEATIKNEVAQANSQMADFKRISTWEVQVNELEKTSTKKVKRYLYK